MRSKIAIIGDLTTVIAFRGLGLKVVVTEDPEDVKARSPASPTKVSR